MTQPTSLKNVIPARQFYYVLFAARRHRGIITSRPHSCLRLIHVTRPWPVCYSAYCDILTRYTYKVTTFARDKKKVINKRTQNRGSKFTSNESIQSLPDEGVKLWHRGICSASGKRFVTKRNNIIVHSTSSYAERRGDRRVRLWRILSAREKCWTL